MLKTIGTMLVASLVSTVSLAQSAPSQSGSSYPSTPDRPPVFVTDSQSWEVSAHSGGGGGAFAGEAHGGARPQTAEIIKTFGERCPQVITNNIQAKTNYVVVLDHEGGKNYFQHRNKVAVFNRVTGDSIVSKSTLSLGGSVQTACEAFRADWTQNAASIRAAEASETAAKEKPPTLQLQQVAESGVTKIFVSSTPAGADIEVDGGFVRNTPSTIDVASGEHLVKVSKNGYPEWARKLKASGGNVNLNVELAAQDK